MGLPFFTNVSFFIRKVDLLLEARVSVAFARMATKAMARSKTGICLLDIAVQQTPKMFPYYHV